MSIDEFFFTPLRFIEIMKKILRSETCSQSFSAATFQNFENKLKLKLKAPSKKSLAEFHCKDAVGENLDLNDEVLPLIKPSKSQFMPKNQNSCINVGYGFYNVIF
jgi:hypothetical protein